MIGTGAAEDIGGHGTHVAGIVAGNGALGGVGVAPAASIVALKILFASGPGQSGSGFGSFALRAVDYIAQNPQLGVRVVNMSLGTSPDYSEECDDVVPSYAAALDTLYNAGIVTVAASGNDSATTIGMPACFSSAVAVGAANNNDIAASFTNSNDLVEVYAPGVGIVASYLENSLDTKSGTSMATPHVGK